MDFPTLIRWMVDVARGEADGGWLPGGGAAGERSDESAGEVNATALDVPSDEPVNARGEPAGIEGAK